MKQLAMMALLLLTSCSGEQPICGGKIVGKYATHSFYLQLESGVAVKVTVEAWNQAKAGMEWPFEVK